jgi:tRNA (adenine22-N1)-methyltransferase
LIAPRLRAVIEAVSQEPCCVLADIGTDHAYLPIEAVRSGLCERAIACDIGAGPLEFARKNICAAGLETRIETRLGDGLAPLNAGEADCIVITGMGGKNIMDILSGAWEKAENARLVLSPQHDLEELRRFLHSNLYNIIEEKLVRERSRYYVIFVARRVSCAEEISPYTDGEYFLGKFRGAEASAYFCERREKILGYISGVSNPKTRQLAEKQLEWLDKKCTQHSG